MARDLHDPSPSGSEPTPGTVAVGLHAPGIAVVSLRGEHDIRTESLLAQALDEVGARIKVLVDPSDSGFIGSRDAALAGLERAIGATAAAGRGA